MTAMTLLRALVVSFGLCVGGKAGAEGEEEEKQLSASQDISGERTRRTQRRVHVVSYGAVQSESHGEKGKGPAVEDGTARAWSDIEASFL